MYKAIVWSTDGSQNAERALPHVKELAKAEGATITIVHVVERIEGGGAVGVPRRADEPAVQAKLQDLAAGLSREGFSVSLIACATPPLPAVSRPSSTSTSRRLLCSSQRATSLSS